MKVLLLDNVKNVGLKGEIKEIADGLARNKLIPQKKAIEATAKNISIYLPGIKRNESNDEPKLKELASFAKHLESPHTITVSVKTDGHGSLYSALHESEIVSPLKASLPEQFHHMVTKDSIGLSQVIKKTGTHHGKLCGILEFVVNIIEEK